MSINSVALGRLLSVAMLATVAMPVSGGAPSAHTLLAGAGGPLLLADTPLPQAGPMPLLLAQAERSAVEEQPEPQPVGQAPVQPDEASVQSPIRSLRPVPQDDMRPVASEPHPLAMALPDHDVVVCVAGCWDAPNTIVYKQKIRVAQAPADPMLKLANSPGVASDATPQSPVSCLAGCYGRSPVVAKGAGSTGRRAGLSGTWISTSAQDAETGAADGSVRVTRGTRQKIRKTGSGDWFTKRFREDQPSY